MAEEIQGQPALDSSTAGAEAKAPEEGLDWESRYNNEIKNSQKQRGAKQDAQKELEDIRAKLDEQNEAKMIEQGKHEELITKLKAENKLLKADSEALQVQKANIREKLLAKGEFTDEEKEKLIGLDNDALEIVVNRTMAQANEIEHPKSTAPAGRVNLPDKPYGQMTEAEREDYHNAKVNQL